MTHLQITKWNDGKITVDERTVGFMGMDYEQVAEVDNEMDLIPVLESYENYETSTRKGVRV